MTAIDDEEDYFHSQYPRCPHCERTHAVFVKIEGSARTLMTVTIHIPIPEPPEPYDPCCLHRLVYATERSIQACMRFSTMCNELHMKLDMPNQIGEIWDPEGHFDAP